MSPKIDVMEDQMAEILRGMTGAERLQIANRMFVSARRMIASHLAAEHPDWDEERIEQETARRISHGLVLASPPGHRHPRWLGVAQMLDGETQAPRCRKRRSSS